jgi:hypothetical protein
LAGPCWYPRASPSRIEAMSSAFASAWARATSRNREAWGPSGSASPRRSHARHREGVIPCFAHASETGKHARISRITPWAISGVSPSGSGGTGGGPPGALLGFFGTRGMEPPSWSRVPRRPRGRVRRGPGRPVPAGRRNGRTRSQGRRPVARSRWEPPGHSRARRWRSARPRAAWVSDYGNAGLALGGFQWPSVARSKEGAWAGPCGPLRRPTEPLGEGAESGGPMRAGRILTKGQRVTWRDVA